MNNKTMQKLPVGKSDFKKVREENCYYIDKTFFIREIIDSAHEVILLPRPRRFGKTLNLSMLRYFFEKSESDLAVLFDATQIQSEQVFAEHQGRYPVIYLTFKDLKALDWDSLYEGFRNMISREIQRHDYILQSQHCSKINRKYLEGILNQTASRRGYEESLLILSELLHLYYGQTVVILIDEYDTPLHSGYQHGYYDEVISFMRNFLSGGLKDNVHLHKGVITGILRVARESIFSGLNNLGVYTLLNVEFNTAFGFTQDEVRCLLKNYELNGRYDEVSYWYDGYLMGGKTIYNPWSVLNFINSRDQFMRPYWVNTASNEIIDKLATREGREIREELGILLEGGSILKPVYDSIVMRDLTTKSDLLWSFLLFSGYLKSTGPPVRQKYYLLTIPNQEVRIIYEDLIHNWFTTKLESNRVESMVQALINGNIEDFEILLSDLVEKVVSFHDTTAEQFYHALVLGMLLWLEGDYEIKSNRESGLGRYDLVLIPRERSKQGIIMEFKKVRTGKYKQTPEQTLKSAMQQIKDKHYAVELESAGVQNILMIAVAFKGKELWMLHE